MVASHLRRSWIELANQLSVVRNVVLAKQLLQLFHAWHVHHYAAAPTSLVSRWSVPSLLRLVGSSPGVGIVLIQILRNRIGIARSLAGRPEASLP